MTTLRTTIPRVVLVGLCLLAGAWRSAAADSIVTLTITVTNTPANGATLTVGGSTRTWTNSVSAPATQIAVLTNDVGGSATALHAHLANYPFTGPLALAQTGTNVLTLRAPLNTEIAASSAGSWATLSLSTNTAVTNLYTVRVPAAAESQNVRRYVADQIVETIGDNALSNAIPATAVALSNHVNTSQAQTITGAKVFTGGATILGLTGSNIVAVGAAISSPGSATGSEEFGTLASATGANSLAVGNQAVATEQNATALGPAAEAGYSNSVAIGRGSLSAAVDGIAVGSGSGVSGDRALAIGSSSFASGMDSIAIGKGATDGGHSNVVAIGTGATGTSAWDFVLGAASHLVRIPGRIIGASLTNATLHGTISVLTGGLIHSTTVSNAIVYATGGLLSGVTLTNATVHATGGTLAGVTLTSPAITSPTVTGATLTNTTALDGVMAFRMTDNTSLVNGNNAAVNPGTGAFLKLSGGPTGNFTIAGLSGGVAGRVLAILNATGQHMTLADESGLEPTAANRILTLAGGDITTTTDALLWLLYDGTTARWIVMSQDSPTVGGGSTNYWTLKGAQISQGNIVDSANLVWQAVGTNISATVSNVATINSSQTFTAGQVFIGGLVSAGVAGVNSTLLGQSASVSGVGATGIGAGVTASAEAAVAVGTNALGSGTRAVAVGVDSISSANYSVAIGDRTYARGAESVAIGVTALATNANTTAVGGASVASAYLATALGTAAYATDLGSTAIGADAVSNHEDSTAVGRGATTTADNQVRLGVSGDTVSVPGLLSVAGSVELPIGVPASPGASTGRLYVTSNGTKLQLAIKWPDGSTNVVATQP